MHIIRRRLHGVESGGVAVTDHRTRPDGKEIRQRVQDISDDDTWRRNDVSRQDRRDRSDDVRKLPGECHDGEL